MFLGCGYKSIIVAFTSAIVNNHIRDITLHTVEVLLLYVRALYNVRRFAFRLGLFILSIH